MCGREEVRRIGNVKNASQVTDPAQSALELYSKCNELIRRKSMSSLDG
jgi:hypothetical protein